MSPEWLYTVVFFAWLAGASMFVIGLHQMNSPATARGGNRVSALGMIIAVGTTLLYLVGRPDGLPTAAWIIILVVFGAVIGSVTFTGSVIAAGKLQGLISGKPIMIPAGRLVTVALAAVAVASTGALVWDAWHAGGASTWTLVIFGGIVAAGLLFGITMVLPIGGADMPVVISLLNSFTGTAAAMAGFVIGNPVLIIAGALVGAAGGILTKLMADAMNRSIMNIIAGGFGGGEGTVGALTETGGSVRAVTPDDVAIQLAYASSVIIVPGYGLAVAQAQHAVRELAELLEARGVDVKYA